MAGIVTAEEPALCSDSNETEAGRQNLRAALLIRPPQRAKASNSIKNFNK
tara:strand:- start:1000 stop:1149 length:150 start_codon:yes stop_codon:yes gene_type:complete